MNPDTEKKMMRLERLLKGYGSLAVAFSGGVDSTFLLSAAGRALNGKVVAVTAASAIHPSEDLEFTRRFASQRGIRHVVFESGETGLSGFVANGRDRCYVCKKHIFSNVRAIAREQGMRHVAHGANLDDLDDHRPGFRAADEMGIVAPLIEAGLHKEEIRALSRRAGLPTWNKPAMACLASRIPHGTPIDPELLRRVAGAEEAVAATGVRFCRVRHHGSVARIEVDPDEFEKLMKPTSRAMVLKKLRDLGYSHVALDLEGYVQGSMNR